MILVKPYKDQIGEWKEERCKIKMYYFDQDSMTKTHWYGLQKIKRNGGLELGLIIPLKIRKRIE